MKSDFAWEVCDLARAVERRSALLALLDSNRPTLPLKSGVTVEPTVREIKRCLLESTKRIWLWNVIWKNPDDGVDLFDALVIVGPASATRLSSDDKGISDTGGGSLAVFARSHEVPLEDLSGHIAKATETLESNSELQRLGYAASWSDNGVQSTLTRTLQYETQIFDLETDWTPYVMTTEDEYQTHRELIDALLSTAHEDISIVESAAASMHSDRRIGRPWNHHAEGDGFDVVARSFFDAANRELIGFETPEDNTKLDVSSRNLSFYSASDLIDIVDRRGGYPRLSRFIADYTLEADGSKSYTTVTPITWKAGTLHQKSNAENLCLTDDTVADYVDLFCQSIEADEAGTGYFRICESSEDLKWVGNRPTEIGKIADRFFPAQLWSKTPASITQLSDEGTSTTTEWRLVFAALVHARALSHCCFAVCSNGETIMITDRKVVSNLPIIPERVTEKTHFIYLQKGEIENA